MDLWHLPSPPQQADNLLSRWYQMGLLGNNMNDHHDEQTLFPLLCQLMNQSPAMTQVLNSLTDMGELLQQQQHYQQQHEEQLEEVEEEEHDSFSCCDEYDCAPLDLSYDSHSHSMAQCEHEVDDCVMEESPCNDDDNGDLWFNNLNQYDESFVVQQCEYQPYQQYEYQPYECQYHQYDQQQEEQLMNDDCNNNNNYNFMHYKYNNCITECCHCYDNATHDETQMLSCRQQTNSPHLEIAAYRSCGQSMIMSISAAAAPIVHQDVHCQCSSRSEQETASNKNQVENEQLVATMQAIVDSSLSRGKAIVIPDSVATRMNNNKTMCTDIEPSCAFDSVVVYYNTVY